MTLGMELGWKCENLVHTKSASRTDSDETSWYDLLPVCMCNEFKRGRGTARGIESDNAGRLNVLFKLLQLAVWGRHLSFSYSWIEELDSEIFVTW